MRKDEGRKNGKSTHPIIEKIKKIRQDYNNYVEQNMPPSSNSELPRGNKTPLPEEINNNINSQGVNVVPQQIEG